MNNGRRVLLHPISAAATALSLMLACVADARAQTAPSGGGAPTGGPGTPTGGPGTPTGSPGAPTGSPAAPTGGPSGSGASTGGTLGGPSDPNPYYIGVSQAFTHDTNVYRIPDGPADTYSSTSLLGGFDQMLGRQHVFGRAVVSNNRYQDETTLDNVSYSAYVGLDWDTIEHLSGRVYASFNRGLSSPPAGAGTPVAAQNISDTQTIEALIRWGGPSLLSLEGGASYSNVGYSSPQYVASEFNKSSANINLFYHGGGPLRIGIGVRADATRTPQAFVDPATGQVQSTRLNGQYVDLLADYDVTGQIGANARLSYTRQENSAGRDRPLRLDRQRGTLMAGDRQDLVAGRRGSGCRLQLDDLQHLRVHADRHRHRVHAGRRRLPEQPDHDIGGHQRDLRGNGQDLRLRERLGTTARTSSTWSRDRRSGTGCDRYLEHLFAGGQLPDHAQLERRLHPGV